MPFEIFQNQRSKKFYFRLKAGNGESIFQSQAYETKSKVKRAIQSVIKNAESETRFEVRKSKNGQDYFVLTAKNGQSLGRSETYKSRSGLKNGIKSVMKNAATGVVKDVSNN